MKKKELTARFPYLWHMAEFGSWPSINERGLLSTSALLDLYKIKGDERVELEQKRRPNSIVIKRDGLPNATIRDQKPMSDGALEKCLKDELSPSDWYAKLNARTFFWLSNTRLMGLLNARAYRNKTQTVLTIDSESLIEAHEPSIELSPINSGSTIFNPVARGHDTFLPIKQYDYDDWRSRRPMKNSIVELVVLGSVPDIANHVLAVHEVTGNQMVEVWRRKGCDPTIGP